MLLWLPPLWAGITILYILKLKRKDVVVSSTYLWQQVIRDVQANSPFQKLRRNLLLLLQLIIITLLIFGLAKPSLRADALGGRSTVLILDTAVSMQSSDGSPTRMDSARAVAYHLIKQMHPGDRMLIVAAGPRPQTESRFTSNSSVLNEAVSTVRATDAPSDMGAALRLASDMVRSQHGENDSQIDLISDGTFLHFQGQTQTSSKSSLDGVDLGNLKLSYYPVGKSDNNIAITAIDYRYSLSGENTIETLVVAHNYTSSARSVVEEVRENGVLSDAKQLVVPSQGDATEVFDMPSPSKKILLEVDLKTSDDLSADNRAYAVLKPRKVLRVLLVGPNNYFLEQALQVDPEVSLDYSAAYPGDSIAEKYDVVVFYQRAPSHLPDGHYLFVHCTSNQSPATVTGTSNGVSAVDWRHSDPALRYVDLNGQQFDNVLTASPRSWGKVIADGAIGPLLVRGENGRTRSLFAAFDPLETRFTLSVGFPIFVSDAVRWLGLGNEGIVSWQIHTGDPVSIPVPTGIPSIKVTNPNGKQETVMVGGNGVALFSDTDLAGIYVASAKGYRWQFAANIVNQNASNIAPVKTLNITTGAASRAKGHKVVELRNLMPLLAVIALLILMQEWYVFHRRVHLG